MVEIIRFSIIGLLISLSSTFTLMTVDILVTPDATVTGKELLEQVIIAAILGVVIGLISLIFKTERLSFIGQLIIHLFGVIIFVLVAGYFGSWYDVTNLSTIMTILISIIVIYVISWGIVLLLQKRDIEEMNRFIQKRRKNL